MSRKRIFGGEYVTISAYLPPSLVTVCHQNFQISKTSLPPPAGDIIFEWPLCVSGGGNVE